MYKCPICGGDPRLTHCYHGHCADVEAHASRPLDFTMVSPDRTRYEANFIDEEPTGDE